MKEGIIITTFLVTIVCGVIFINYKITTEKIKDCEPSKVVRIEPVGHRGSTSYSCFLENGEYGTCSNSDLKIGDMACLVGCYVYAK